ncbi:MAG: 50S ribosomal protein L13 [Candidatus Omnitrophica bacterium]|nr:50S ribosomal protein L13 [Candidatus Omnitrophota bacterium]
MKKTQFKPQERAWHLIDAKDKILGRLAVRISMILQGKNKATYSPQLLSGDRVVVINARHIKTTKNKIKTKVYDKYTGYPSGRKEMTLERLHEKNPTKVLRYAVKGMLPRGPRGKLLLRSLKIYADETHDQHAQNPQELKVL